MKIQTKKRILQGEKLYRDFWKKFSYEKTLDDLVAYGCVDNHDQIITQNALRAVFLGVKPSTEIREHKIPEIDFSLYGLKSAGAFVYDPESVNQIISENADVFNDKNPTAIFTEIDRKRDRHNPVKLSPEEYKTLDLQIGLILGFPRSSCEWFANDTAHDASEAKKNRISYEVGDICWVNGVDQDQAKDEAYKHTLQNSFSIADAQ